MCCGLLLVHWTTASFISTCPVIILVVSDKRTSAYFEPWLLQSSCEANAHGAKWLWTVSHFNIFTFHVVQASHIYSKWMSLNTNLHLNCFMRSLVSIKLKGGYAHSNMHFFTFNWLTLTSEMHFVKFHPEVTACLFSRVKRKYAPLGMRLLWKYIRNYFLETHYIKS